MRDEYLLADDENRARRKAVLKSHDGKVAVRADIGRLQKTGTGEIVPVITYRTYDDAIGWISSVFRRDDYSLLTTMTGATVSDVQARVEAELGRRGFVVLQGPVAVTR